jgi:hypothetical protein
MNDLCKEMMHIASLPSTIVLTVHYCMLIYRRIGKFIHDTRRSVRVIGKFSFRSIKYNVCSVCDSNRSYNAKAIYVYRLFHVSAVFKLVLVYVTRKAQQNQGSSVQDMIIVKRKIRNQLKLRQS